MFRTSSIKAVDQSGPDSGAVRVRVQSEYSMSMTYENSAKSLGLLESTSDASIVKSPDPKGEQVPAMTTTLPQKAQVAPGQGFLPRMTLTCTSSDDTGRIVSGTRRSPD